MMKNKKIYLTEKEYELMKILWNSNRPLTSSEILAQRDEDILAARSFHSLINNLIDKGYVKICGHIKQVKTPSRIYAANISASEHTARQLKQVFSDKKQIVPQLNEFLSYFKNDLEKSGDKIDIEFEKRLEKIKKEMEEGKDGWN